MSSSIISETDKIIETYKVLDIDVVKDFITTLQYEELKDISDLIYKTISAPIESEQTSLTEQSRLFNGLVCPNCGSIDCVKNGKVRGKQRLLCNDCHKTFGANSKSAISNSNLTQTKWIAYIECMIQGLSIRKSAEITDVCVKTSFYMRHRILCSINEFMGRGVVSGNVEMDETFLAESFKGNHVKSGFEMPRKPRKRGKQVSKRGISDEQICIGTALDGNDNLIMEMLCRGRATSNKLNDLYNGHISESSTVCTDSLSGYKTLSKKLNLKHKPIASGKHTNGIFNLQRINSLHSRFKTWIRRFNGVSTKFLPNYLKWFKWIEFNKTLREESKADKLWKDAMSLNVDVGIRMIRGLETAFV